MESNGKALRYDEGKLDWTLLDFHAVEPLVRVMEYGATKYARENWKLPLDDPMQHIRCAFRHLIAIASGQEIDPESGERHSGHVMANMMMYNYHRHSDRKQPSVPSECHKNYCGDVFEEIAKTINTKP